MDENSRYRRANIALFIASFITFSDIYLCQPLLPIFAQEFGLSSSGASMAVSLVILPMGLSFLFYAPVAEALGKKKLLSIVLFLSAFPGILSAFAGSFNAVLAGRLLDGLLLAGVPAIAMAYIGEEFDSKRLAQAMGLYIAGNTLGGMGGRIISGYIADILSWRESFLILSLLHLAGAILFFYLLPASKNFKPMPYKPLGALASIPENIRNPRLLGAYITGGLIMFIFVGMFNLLTFRLAAPPYSLSPDLLGLVFLTYASGTLSAAMIGILSRRRGVLHSALLGLCLSAVGLFLTASNLLWVIILGLLVFCFGFFAAHSSATSWVSQAATGEKAAASGLYVLIYYSGGSLSGVALSPVWDAWGWWGVVALCTGLLLVSMLAISRIMAQQGKRAGSAQII